MIKKTKEAFKLSDITSLTLIKVGGQARIFQGNLLINHKNQQVIVKLYERDPRSLQSFATEYKILKLADHPVIIRLFGVMDHYDGPSLVLKRPSNVSLAAIIHWLKINKLKCPPQVIYYIFWRLLKALKYLHSGVAFREGVGVIHGDISSSNIVFSPQGQCYLIDFGAAFFGPQKTEAAFGLKKYLAPEHFQGFVSFYSDLYSLAAVMFELALLRPFDLDSLSHDFSELALYLKTSDLFFFLRACLAPSPRFRPQAAVVLQNLRIKDHTIAKAYLADLISTLS